MYETSKYIRNRFLSSFFAIVVGDRRRAKNPLLSIHARAQAHNKPRSDEYNTREGTTNIIYYGDMRVFNGFAGRSVP